MPPLPVSLVIATRESALALWQARHVSARLVALYPGLSVQLLGMTTRGDQLLDTTLSKIGGKGLFVKELEQALEAGRADLAVHSMKDVPMALPPGFALAAILEREDPRDAFVSNRYRNLSELPPGALVGTSSLRRESQLRAHYPHLRVAPLRGNVGTRLRRLDEGRFDAILLAAAGLKRLEFEHRVSAFLAPEQSLPAAGQGAIGLEIHSRRDDLQELLAPLNHDATALCVRAERALSRALGGSCQVPLGAYAVLQDNALHLRGFVASPEGREFVEDAVAGPAGAPESLGKSLAEKLLARGAGTLLERLADG